MPRVASYTNQVGVADVTGARFRAADFQSGVEQLAQGGRSVARGLDSAAEAMDAARAKEDETRAKAADNAFVDQIRKVEEGFFATQNGDTLAARGDTEKAINSIYDKTLAGATSEREKAMLASVLDRRRQASLEGVGRHSTAQAQSYAKITSEGRIARATDDFARLGGVGKEADLALGTIRSEAEAQADIMGVDGDARTALVQRSVSDARAAVVQNLMISDVGAAKDYLDKHRGDIDWKVELQLDQAMKGPLDERWANEQANVIMGSATDDNAASVNYGDPLRGLGTGVSSSFGADRGAGKKHNGVDFTARVGTPIYPMGSGKVIAVDKVGAGKAGIHVIIDHGDGTTSSYSHMNGTDLDVGDIVSPDTKLGGVGMTGHTTGPHLHMVVKKNGQTADPNSVIGGVHQGARKHDLGSLYAKADMMAAEYGWTPEKTESVKAKIDRRVSRDEQLLARDQRDADEAAMEVVFAKGEGFTNTAAIPASVWSSLSPSDKIKYQTLATSNAKPKEVQANSAAAAELEFMLAADPKRFGDVDLGKYAGKVTRSEFIEFGKKQIEIRKGKADKEVSLRESVNSTINMYATKDMKVTGAKRDQTAFVQLHETMADYLRNITGGTRQPTDAESKEAFLRATRQLNTGTNAGERVKPLFQFNIDDVPPAWRTRIADQYRRINGRAPTDEEIAVYYRRTVGRGI